MKNYNNEYDDDSNDYGFFCHLEDNSENTKKYNKERYDIIISSYTHMKIIPTKPTFTSDKLHCYSSYEKCESVKNNNSKDEKYKYQYIFCKITLLVSVIVTGIIVFRIK